MDEKSAMRRVWDPRLGNGFS